MIELRAGNRATCATFASGKVMQWGHPNRGDGGVPWIVDDIDDAVSALPLGYATLVLHRDGALERIDHGAARSRKAVATSVSAFTERYVIREGRVERHDIRDAVTVEGVAERIGPASDLIEIGDYACARASTGKAACWGKPPYGTGETKVATEVPGSGIEQLAGNDSRLCARDRGGAVRCWERGKPRAVEHEPAVELAVGLGFSCVRTRDGRVQCSDDKNLLPTLPPILAPASEDPVERISADFRHVCLLRKSGKLECAGDNENGQLGDGAPLVQTRPRAVAGVSAARLSLGPHGSCAFDRAGEASCWGDRIGDRPRRVPELDASLIASSASRLWSQRRADLWVTSASRKLAFSAAGHDAKLPLRALAATTVWGDLCTVDADGLARCTKEAADALPSERLRVLDQAASLHAGAFATCGVIQGKIACVKRVEERFHAVRVPPLTARAVAAGAYFACAVTEARGVSCFDVSQVRSAAAARPIEALAEVDQIVMGAHFGCARSAGAVRCFAVDDDGGKLGELGNGERVRGAPFVAGPVSLPGKAVELSAGPRHACAVVEGGQVLCWGDDRGSQSTGTRRASSDALVEVAKPR